MARRALSLALLAALLTPVAAVIVAADFHGAVVVLASVATLVLSCWLMHQSSIMLNLRNLTIPGLFFLSYLAYMVFPAFFVYGDNPVPNSTRDRYLFATLSVLLTLPVGMVLANLLLRFRRAELIAFREREVQDADGGWPRVIVFVGMLLLGVLVTVAYAMRVQTLPILYLFQNPGAFAELSELRQNAGVELGSLWLFPHYYYQILLYPLLSLLALGQYLVSKRPLWRWLFIASASLGVIHSSLTAAKSPVAEMMVIILVFYFTFRRGRINFRYLVFGMGLVFAFPIAVTTFAYWGELGAGDVLFALGHRIFYTPSWLVYKMFEVFPDMVPPLHGRTIGRLAWLLGEEHFNVPLYMAYYINPLNQFLTGSANAAFIGNLNADFGMAGVIFGGIFTGGIMQVLQVAIVRRPKTVGVIAVMSYQAVVFTLLSHTALPPVLLSYGTLLSIVVVWFMRGAEGVLRDTERRASRRRPHAPVAAAGNIGHV